MLSSIRHMHLRRSAGKRSRRFTASGSKLPDKELRVLRAEGSDKIAWILSSYSEEGGRVRGTSLAVWQREDDGNWRIRLCNLNSVEWDVAT
jgi:hypothetical protein